VNISGSGALTPTVRTTSLRAGQALLENGQTLAIFKNRLLSFLFFLKYTFFVIYCCLGVTKVQSCFFSTPFLRRPVFHNFATAVKGSTVWPYSGWVTHWAR
jgi:hypothetical protein